MRAACDRQYDFGYGRGKTMGAIRGAVTYALTVSIDDYEWGMIAAYLDAVGC